MQLQIMNRNGHDTYSTVALKGDHKLVTMEEIGKIFAEKKASGGAWIDTINKAVVSEFDPAVDTTLRFQPQLVGG